MRKVRAAASIKKLFFLGAGIKAQVCSLMELLTTTLYQAHALFYTLPEGVPSDPTLPCSLLFSMLETTTGQDPAGEQLAQAMRFGIGFTISWSFVHVPHTTRA